MSLAGDTSIYTCLVCSKKKRTGRFVYPSTSPYPKGKARHLLLVLLLCLCNPFKELLSERFRNGTENACPQKRMQKYRFSAKQPNFSTSFLQQTQIFLHILDLAQSERMLKKGVHIIIYIRLTGKDDRTQTDGVKENKSDILCL